MERRGRPPLGAEHAQSLDASELAKDRLEIILQTIAGELSVDEACAELGIGPAQFHRLRKRALSGAAEALEPKPAGRRPRTRDARDERIEALEAELAEANDELEIARIREELALILPDVLREPTRGSASVAAKKKRRAKSKRARQARRKGRKR